MLMLVCRKIFSAFCLTSHESFSNSCGFALLQEFNPLYPHLVLYVRKHFCLILTDLSNLLFLFHKIKQRMGRMFLPNSFQKCRSSRSQMFFKSRRPEMFCKKAVLRDFPKFTGQLYLKRDHGTGVSCEFCEIRKSNFSYRTPLVAASSSSK